MPTHQSAPWESDRRRTRRWRDLDRDGREDRLAALAVWALVCLAVAVAVVAAGAALGV
jgi:hypothetical protein